MEKYISILVIVVILGVVVFRQQIMDELVKVLGTSFLKMQEE